MLEVAATLPGVTDACRWWLMALPAALSWWVVCVPHPAPSLGGTPLIYSSPSTAVVVSVPAGTPSRQQSGQMWAVKGQAGQDIRQSHGTMCGGWQGFPQQRRVLPSPCPAVSASAEEGQLLQAGLKPAFLSRRTIW